MPRLGERPGGGVSVVGFVGWALAAVGVEALFYDFYLLAQRIKQLSKGSNAPTATATPKLKKVAVSAIPKIDIPSAAVPAVAIISATIAASTIKTI